MPNNHLQPLYIEQAKLVKKAENKKPKESIWKLSLPDALRCSALIRGEMSKMTISTNHTMKFLAFLRMCNNIKDLGRQFNKETLGLPKPITNDALLGIEIEIEKCPNPKNFLIPGWRTDQDGSLKDRGAEYISVPMKPKEIFKAVPALFFTMKMLAKKDEEPQFTWRCGIHVHMNIRDFTVEQLFKLLLLYAIFEKPLFRFATMERERSVFCVPLQETYYSMLLRNLFTKEDLREVSQGWEKYCAVNLIRMRDYGTIEFRHMSGTKDSEKILTWMNLLLALGQAAKNLSVDEIIQEIFQLNTTSQYDVFVKKVFPKELIHILWVNEFDTYLSKGVTFAKECISSDVLTNDPNLADRMRGSGLEDFLVKKFGRSGKRPPDENPELLKENQKLQWGEPLPAWGAEAQPMEPINLDDIIEDVMAIPNQQQEGDF